MAVNQTVSVISQFLAGDAPLAREVVNALPEWKEKYPFFVPFRYLEALGTTKYESDDKAFAALSPYAGNWILLGELRHGNSPQQKKSNPALKSEKAAAVAPVTHADIVEVEVVEIETLPISSASPDVVSVSEAPGSVSAATISDNPIPGTTTEPADFLPPLYTQDYFMHSGEKVSDEIPPDFFGTEGPEEDETEKSLMVMMSFTEWLAHFKSVSEKQQAEDRAQKALKTMWQREKLAAAMEVDDEEIPERVLEMAVNSISMESGLASETLADLYVKQGKIDHAIDMYRKLSLGNPQKNAYFAHKIEVALKEKQS